MVRCLMRRVISIAAAILLLTFVSVMAGCGGGNGNEQGITPGSEAPDFQLRDLDGRTVALSEFRGRPVVLNFWASWCGPCQMEMPVFQEVFTDEMWKAGGLVILAVNLGESPELVQEFVEYYGLTFPVLLDSSAEVGMMYNAAVLPTTYFIDNDGIIRSIKRGAFTTRQDLDRLIMDTMREVDSQGR
jgi:peroxiredoxin